MQHYQSFWLKIICENRVTIKVSNGRSKQLPERWAGQIFHISAGIIIAGTGCSD